MITLGREGIIFKEVFEEAPPPAPATAPATPAKPPLKIGYSDWPGWTAFEIGIQKGWFKEAGVDTQFEWFEYAPSQGFAIRSCEAHDRAGHFPSRRLSRVPERELNFYQAFKQKQQAAFEAERERWTRLPPSPEPPEPDPPDGIQPRINLRHVESVLCSTFCLLSHQSPAAGGDSGSVRFKLRSLKSSSSKSAVWRCLSIASVGGKRKKSKIPWQDSTERLLIQIPLDLESGETHYV